MTGQYNNLNDKEKSIILDGGQSLHLVVSIMIFTNQVVMFVKCVMRSCLVQLVNFALIADGHLLMMQFKVPLEKKRCKFGANKDRNNMC